VSGPGVIELNDSGSGGPQTVRVGQEVVIRIRENPTTGYSWELRQSGSGALRVVENRFEAGGGSTPMIGAGGQRIVRLVGERAGQVQIEMVERRPWESESASQQRRGFTVQVQQ
jgi:inhibitor of cysteine peptidase